MLFSEPKIPQSNNTTWTAVSNASFSALQRAENSSIEVTSAKRYHRLACFSALQRAENSSIIFARINRLLSHTFQCSSASRKFLNLYAPVASVADGKVSVLFSEPKIPQCDVEMTSAKRFYVSVLFSEPKIPQSGSASDWLEAQERFSALQRAENSSICDIEMSTRKRYYRFSALQRAENSSISRLSNRSMTKRLVSVLFSEPKIPQCADE